ncbi:hypothetical protein A2732_01975 [Candidatus Nomurabacteria bacterium RIFCSPHIGHO2_01_FULL_40_10]|nr:MAG: hypothetical protein A2732_01975 [Candidatus Nomurabacteria bacterium RIFCSPHIGHO2_01_FULL_40_10]
MHISFHGPHARALREEIDVALRVAGGEKKGTRLTRRSLFDSATYYVVNRRTFGEVRIDMIRRIEEATTLPDGTATVSDDACEIFASRVGTAVIGCARACGVGRSMPSWLPPLEFQQ